MGGLGMHVEAAYGQAGEPLLKADDVPRLTPIGTLEDAHSTTIGPVHVLSWVVQGLSVEDPC